MLGNDKRKTSDGPTPSSPQANNVFLSVQDTQAVDCEESTGSIASC